MKVSVKLTLGFHLSGSGTLPGTISFGGLFFLFFFVLGFFGLASAVSAESAAAGFSLLVIL